MDDHWLVRECLKGNSTAQKQFYEQFAPVMLAVCYRYTKSLADAEDVLQDGFIKAFRNMQQFKGEGNLGGWLRRIMVTTAINFLKKESRYQTDLVFGDEPLHAVSSYEPHVHLDAKELAELIRQLPAGYQTIFNLHAVEGYTHVEIGKMLGVKESTSRSQYARARALLIQWIEKHNSDVKNGTYAR
ncbi:MAG: RNA polymerase sigma factor [Chitinophagaceae bacterium]|nr:MAG: RNA polymerase sigma factor [Chitinophagaceae bacterium]